MFDSDLQLVLLSFVSALSSLRVRLSQYGIGTLWDDNNLTTSHPPCSYALDSEASRVYQDMSVCSDIPVPLEQDFGKGKACGHWDDSCFIHELMTGFDSGSMPLSRLTVAGLEDLGYEVDYSEADPYDYADLNTTCVCVLVKEQEEEQPKDDSDADDTTSITIHGKHAPRQGETTTAVHKRNSPASSSQHPEQRQRRRQLSEEGLEVALKYGRDLLTQRKVKKSKFEMSQGSESKLMWVTVLFPLFIWKMVKSTRYWSRRRIKNVVHFGVPAEHPSAF